MSTSQTEFTELVGRIHAGDETALGTLIHCYEHEIRRVVRAHLGRHLRPYLDSLDVAQSINLILLHGLRGGKFDLACPQQLISLAATLIRRKLDRYWQRAKRQERIDPSVEDDEANYLDVLASLQRPSEDPAHIAEYNDQLTSLLAELSDIERQIVNYRLQGLSTAEVGRLLGADPDVLRVRLSRLRDRLRKQGVALDWL